MIQLGARSGNRPRLARIGVTAAAVALVGGALAGCSRFGTGAQPAPAAVTSTTAPVPSNTTAATSSPSLSSIQSDLDSASTSAANASGDVAAGDAAAATNDNN